MRFEPTVCVQCDLLVSDISPGRRLMKNKPNEVCNMHCKSKQLSGSPFHRVTGTSNAAVMALLRTTTYTSTISPIAGNGGMA